MLLCRTRTQSWDAGNGCRERVKVGKDARFAHHLHAHAGAVGADIGGVTVVRGSVLEGAYSWLTCADAIRAG
jgi:hypothetical protein